MWSMAWVRLLALTIPVRLTFSLVPTCEMRFLVRVVVLTIRLDRTVALAALFSVRLGVLMGTSVSPVVPSNSVPVESTRLGETVLLWQVLWLLIMLTPAVALKLIMTMGELHVPSVVTVPVTWLVFMAWGPGTLTGTLQLRAVPISSGSSFSRLFR